uniref:Uncharacterized protein n=1 Tax=Anopheles gambiae TaxID=7165 RepID=A0A0E3W275_ANOGA
MHIVLEDDKAVDVEFEFVLSMIEGKVLSYMLDDSSTTCCLICCAAPSEMMDASILASGFIGQEEPLVYSISPIHCWLTFFELLLQLSYRMDFKEWQVPEVQRTTFNERMKTVQQRLYEAFGVRVAEADAGSSSSTNTMGYISRRVLADPALASTTLNIDQDLIERFRNILIAINSRHPLHPAKVQQYCSDTYRKYLELYSWSRVPAAVQKVLAHAGQLIVRSPLRLGYVGKKSGEIEHNYFTSDRELCARTTSKQDALKDPFVEALICSDPKISSISLSNRIKRKKRAAYPDVVASFFIFDESYCETDDDDDSNSGDDDEDDLDSLDEFWTELDWLNEDIAHVKG